MSVVIASLKGGIDKTNNLVLLERNLAALGRRVFLIDLDSNNSLDYSFSNKKTIEKTKTLSEKRLKRMVPTAYGRYLGGELKIPEVF
jgi:cellulose biosynthesis protein BcsQ